MIGYLKGKIKYIDNNIIIIDCGNIGYNVYVTPKVLSKQIGDEIEIYIYEAIREDAYDLYGFLMPGELDFFKNLISFFNPSTSFAVGVVPLEIIFVNSPKKL